MSNDSTQTGSDALSLSDATDMLLDTNAPEEASEVIEEPTEEESTEYEAADDDEGQVEYEEDDSEDTAEDDAEYYTVKVDGEEMKVTPEDLVKSYQLEKAAQKRLQEAAQKRKSAEEQMSAIEQERLRYAQGLQALEQQLTQGYQEPTQEYWNKLYEDDPLEYIKQKDAYRDRREQISRVQQEQAQMYNQALEQERQKMYQIIPEWQDPQTESKEKKEVLKFAQAMGYETQQIQNFTARDVALLRRAYLYDYLQEQKPTVKKKIAKAPKMVKGGSPKTSRQVSSEASKKAFDKLRKTGSKEDAVNFLLSRK